MTAEDALHKLITMLYERRRFWTQLPLVTQWAIAAREGRLDEIKHIIDLCRDLDIS